MNIYTQENSPFRFTNYGPKKHLGNPRVRMSVYLSDPINSSASFQNHETFK